MNAQDRINAAGVDERDKQAVKVKSQPRSSSQSEKLLNFYLDRCA